ncbi:MAG: hypothetical protein LBQ31_04775 [Bacteroidales bacterium]|jgi:hypothetical protein|nr:hypothetical protein [Bacteroidales bacterium]
MKQELKETELLICRCHSHEHQIFVYYDEDHKELYLCIHLTEHGFWRRLKSGLKYIFGYHCRYGHWDEFLFDKKDADKLQAMADALR